MLVQGDSVVASRVQHGDVMRLLRMLGGRCGLRGRRSVGASVGLPRSMRGAGLAASHGVLDGLRSNVH